MKKGINKYLGAFAMGTVLMASPSCTDTWNEHYQPQGDDQIVTESLWQLLQNDEDLSRFRSIIETAKFYRDENHPAFTLNGKDSVFYTFKDVLSANTPITVWAPVNSALSEEEWKKYEKMRDNDGYNLQQQFIGNHVALYRRKMAKSQKETFRLINSKFATTDDMNFQKSQVIKNDIPARNGLLHKLNTHNEFFFNIYEYIKFSGESNIKRISNYLVQRDTTYFSEDSSIEGLPDENGNPTYVDSVYFQDNLMFSRSSYNPIGFSNDAMDAADAWMNSLKMFNARINVEDSSYIMVVPTDVAWDDAARHKMDPYYNYGTGLYPRMSKVKMTQTKKSSIDIFGARRTFATGKGYETVDSLQAVNIDMDIIDPLVFNVNLQPQINGTAWTVENFLKDGDKCEYWLTTRGDTIRDIVNEDGTVVWDKNVLLSGTQKEMSNGYAIVSDVWNYPDAFWKRDIDVETSSGNVYDNSSSTRISNYDLNTSKWEGNVYGSISQNRYLSVDGSSASTKPEIAFRLNGCKLGSADVMSGAKYDVMVVLVPWWFNLSDEVEPSLPEEDKFLKNRLVFKMYAWNPEKANSSDYGYKKQELIRTETLEYDGVKVDTFTVMTDVTFPVSYKNIQDAFPVLQITTDVSNSEMKQGYHRFFNIDRIILKCKE